MRTFFTSGSITDSVLNFGLAAPIDVQLTAPTYRALFPVARAVEEALRSVPEVANTFIPQEADYPTLRVKVDRVKAAHLGLNQYDVVANVIAALKHVKMGSIPASTWRSLRGSVATKRSCARSPRP